MKKVFFISDAHIGAESSEQERIKTEKLFRFFDIVASEGSAVYILGDFFDFWFDYRKVIPSKYFKILCKLASLADAGVEIHIFGGNHDWWMKKNGFFARNFGIKIHPKPMRTKIFGKRFFLAHGDGIAPSDWGYRDILCPILRNPLSVWLFGLLPAEWGLALAKLVSSSSKLYTEKRNLRFEQEYENFAQKIIADGVDYVVMGHLHIVVNAKLNGGIYANIGDFFKNFSYAEFDGEKFEIKTIEQ